MPKFVRASTKKHEEGACSFKRARLFIFSGLRAACGLAQYSKSASLFRTDAGHDAIVPELSILLDVAARAFDENDFITDEAGIAVNLKLEGDVLTEIARHLEKVFLTELELGCIHTESS
jgi:hypothetical protein